MIVLTTSDLINRPQSFHINSVNISCIKNRQILNTTNSFAIQINNKVKILKTRFGNDVGRIYLVNDFKQKYNNE